MAMWQWPWQWQWPLAMALAMWPGRNTGTPRPSHVALGGRLSRHPREAVKAAKAAARERSTHRAAHGDDADDAGDDDDDVFYSLFYGDDDVAEMTLPTLDDAAEGIDDRIYEFTEDKSSKKLRTPQQQQVRPAWVHGRGGAVVCSPAAIALAALGALSHAMPMPPQAPLVEAATPSAPGLETRSWWQNVQCGLFTKET